MPDTLTPVHPLLRGILDHPREFDRLLVYADWLEEHGVSGPCGRCGGRKVVTFGPHPMVPFDDSRRMVPRSGERRCPTCNGTGRADAAVLALGWRLLAGQRRWPWPSFAERGMVWWDRQDAEDSAKREQGLPTRVFALLAGGEDAGGGLKGMYRDYRGGGALPAALADAARAFGLARLAGRQPEEARRG